MNSYNEILAKYNIDYLLVNSTNEYLVEYSALSENARYVLTGFSGSTGDALITKDKIYLFVDGRYYTQADNEVKEGITVVKLRLGQRQDDEIRKIINPDKVLGIVSKKVSQIRLESFNGYKIKLIDEDPINSYTEKHTDNYIKAFEPVNYQPDAVFISNLEEVSYLTGLRDFSKDCSSKIWAKLFINRDKRILFTDNKECAKFLSSYEGPLRVDKNSINAHDFELIKHPVHKSSEVKFIKSIKSEKELEAYKKAFERTDKAVSSIRNYIEENDNLSEYDIAVKLKEEFLRYGAKSLSFNSIVAINENSAQAHYSKNSNYVILRNGDLVLIDCGAYYESGLATDITRVFVKGNPSQQQKKVYTLVLKAFLNAFNYKQDEITSGSVSGYEIDTLAHSVLDDAIEGFSFGHGLGHGIGINVHEAPPNLSQNELAKEKIVNGMTFTIEPGLYNPDEFGVRLENSCYMENGKIKSFVKMGYEGKLIDYKMLSDKEQQWLKEFAIL